MAFSSSGVCALLKRFFSFCSLFSLSLSSFAVSKRAIRDDPVRLEEASKDPEVAKVLLGDDMNALQELLRAYHLAEKRRRADMAHRSTDAQRVSATVPR